MELKSTIPTEVKVSPLVKKLVDLRFSQLTLENKTNESSLINDLSLDQIVNAIINSSIESSNTEPMNEQNAKNETHEDNLINTERQTLCSPDSGFKSSTTEYSHQLEGNFQCRCKSSMIAQTNCTWEKTIINMNETFNERCVDEVRVRSRKRASSTPPESCSKKPHMNKSEDDNINFTLKRQRCIRRRKTEDEKKKLTKTDIHFLDDDSFENIPNDKISTPLRQSSPNETFTLFTPMDTNRKSRRCLLFESPTSLSESSLATNNSIKEVRGSMDLSIQHENGTLHVNGK